MPAAHAWESGVPECCKPGSGQQLLAERGRRKVLAGAGEGIGLVQEQNLPCRDVETALKSIDEIGEPADLQRGWDGLIKVADHADADAVWVDFPSPGRWVGRLLLIPALPDLDLPIHRPIAVPDHKMIRNAIGSLGDGQSATRKGSAVVNVDILPSTWLDGCPGLEDHIHRLGGINRKQAVGHVGPEWRRRQSQKQCAGQRQDADERSEYDNPAI